MLVKRKAARDNEMILPTSSCCLGARKSAWKAWPFILFALAATTLLLWATSIASTDPPEDVHSSPQVAVAARCVDLKPECSEWVADHQCRTNPQFMHHFCSASCKLCIGASITRPGGAGPAVDAVSRQPPAAMPSRAPNGQIGRPVVYERPSVWTSAAEKTAAQRSAGQSLPVVEQAVVVDSSANREPDERSTVERPALSVAQPSEDCEDLHTRCEAWSQAGECEKNPSFMKVGCKMSCRLCTSMSPLGRMAA